VKAHTATAADAAIVGPTVIHEISSTDRQLRRSTAKSRLNQPEKPSAGEVTSGSAAAGQPGGKAGTAYP